jgi:Tfp pilus assembly protein PilP
MTSVLVAVVLVVTLIVPATLAAQAPKGAAPAAATPGQPPPPAPPPDYEYRPDNRRDPFLDLTNRGTDSRASEPRGQRPEGLAGITVDEVVVRGIVQSRGGFMAMIGAPSGRTYTVRAGDRLMDGSIRTITAQSVVLMQEINDPLSLAKQREVRKRLRPEVK